jgi:hypothetical protein
LFHSEALIMGNVICNIFAPQRPFRSMHWIIDWNFRDLNVRSRPDQTGPLIPFSRGSDSKLFISGKGFSIGFSHNGSQPDWHRNAREETAKILAMLRSIVPDDTARQRWWESWIEASLKSGIPSNKCLRLIQKVFTM